VIIVMPPALISANAAVLASVSDATVLVARSRRTRLDELERSLQMLKSLGSHKCLVVIDNVSRADSADLHNKQ
jgi:Mrp family chromosome partitioning ATPase